MNPGTSFEWRKLTLIPAIALLEAEAAPVEEKKEAKMTRRGSAERRVYISRLCNSRQGRVSRAAALVFLPISTTYLEEKLPAPFVRATTDQQLVRKKASVNKHSIFC